MGIEQNATEEKPMVLCRKMSLENIALVRDVDEAMSSGSLDFNPLQLIRYMRASSHLSSCDTCMRNYNLMDENYVPTPSPMARIFLTPRYG